MGYITMGLLHCNVKCKERFWITLLPQISCHRLIMKLQMVANYMQKRVFHFFPPPKKKKIYIFTYTCKCISAIYTVTVDNPKVILLLFCKMTKEKKKRNSSEFQIQCLSKRSVLLETCNYHFSQNLENLSFFLCLYLTSPTTCMQAVYSNFTTRW